MNLKQSGENFERNQNTSLKNLAIKFCIAWSTYPLPIGFTDWLYRLAIKRKLLKTRQFNFLPAQLDRGKILHYLIDFRSPWLGNPRCTRKISVVDCHN